MMIRKLLTASVCAMLAPAVVSAQLWVDFNSTTQDGGPHPQAGYESYDAGHEVAADFVTMSYSAFGATIGVTPAWPNTTDNRVQQMIDRGMGNDDQWMGDDLDLLTDFLGIDSRTGNGGNGDWLRDGASEPTYMTLALSGLPAGDYNWKSFHHDTENVWADFQVEVSTDGGANYALLGDYEMSSTSTGGNPPNPGLITTGPVSMVETSFSASGSDDVVLRFAPFADGVDTAAVHKQIFGINGFQLSVVPEPSSLMLTLIAFGSVAGWLRRR